MLERRLRERGTDDDATIARRLANARREIEASEGYDVQLVNDDLEACVDALVATLAEHQCAGGIGHD